MLGKRNRDDDPLDFDTERQSKARKRRDGEFDENDPQHYLAFKTTSSYKKAFKYAATAVGAAGTAITAAVSVAVQTGVFQDALILAAPDGYRAVRGLDEVDAPETDLRVAVADAVAEEAIRQTANSQLTPATRVALVGNDLYNDGVINSIVSYLRRHWGEILFTYGPQPIYNTIRNNPRAAIGAVSVAVINSEAFKSALRLLIESFGQWYQFHLDTKGRYLSIGGDDLPVP